ncbi:MAG TPA: FAD:protein FMN transferase [Solirubrobacterales bacterium]|nr:FAD:protein FMN transferase [Solirubrobacterales bacterium]
MTAAEHDTGFEAMGSHVRLLIGAPAPGLPPAEAAAERARSFVAEFERALSRFDPASELSALNRDHRDRVPASPLLRQAVGAGLWAAERSGGLVDPTLVDEIERAGYASSRVGVRPAPLRSALAAAPERRPAEPDPAARWRRFSVDGQGGEIVRPPGLRFDSGGIGKGLAADLVASALQGYSRFVVDCGGDIRVGGRDAPRQPRTIAVEHPLSGDRPFVVSLRSGGIATSGLDVRIWRREDGSFAHHLLDPASGRPAWTGLVGVTALGVSALEAETLSKAALLAGPARGRELLAAGGGLLVHDSGRVERVGRLAAPPRVRLPRPPAREGVAA